MEDRERWTEAIEEREKDRARTERKRENIQWREMRMKTSVSSATTLLFSSTLSSRHRNFLWHLFVAALARFLLKPAALLCKSDGSGGSSKVRFQRRLKDGLKMSEELAWQLH